MGWSTIKSASHNPVVRVSYLVVIGLPIVVEILNKYGKQVEIGDSVYHVFYSSLLLLVVAGIYFACAPDEIQKYTDLNDYVTKNKETLLVMYPDLKKEIVMAHLDDTQKESKEKIISLNLALTNEKDSSKAALIKAELEQILVPLLPGAVIRYLQKQWQKADSRTNRIMMYFATALYYIAGMLALIVFAHRVYIVINTQII